VAIIAAQADEADRASQRDGEAISRAVRLDDLIGEFEVFGAAYTNTVDGSVTATVSASRFAG
jgi:hypothetical protein